MADYQARVRLTLTQTEAGAAMVMFTSAEAGDLDELMNGDLRRSAAALRALDKLRAAIAAAEGRTAEKADRKRREAIEAARCPNGCGEVTFTAGRYHCRSCGSTWNLEMINDA